MGKNKIYWFLQQLEFLGGTETATISIANKLADFYDLTLVVSGKKVDKIPYAINPKINIVFLNNDFVTKIDENMLKKWNEKKYFGAISIFFRSLNFSLFGKYKFRKEVLRKTSSNDILIASSNENYVIMPRKRNFIFHTAHKNFHTAFSPKDAHKFLLLLLFIISNNSLCNPVCQCLPVIRYD